MALLFCAFLQGRTRALPSDGNGKESLAAKKKKSMYSTARTLTVAYELDAGAVLLSELDGWWMPAPVQ